MFDICKIHGCMYASNFAGTSPISRRLQTRIILSIASQFILFEIVFLDIFFDKFDYILTNFVDIRTNADFLKRTLIFFDE